MHKKFHLRSSPGSGMASPRIIDTIAATERIIRVLSQKASSRNRKKFSLLTICLQIYLRLLFRKLVSSKLFCAFWRRCFLSQLAYLSLPNHLPHLKSLPLRLFVISSLNFQFHLLHSATFSFYTLKYVFTFQSHYYPCF